ncbi:hypothetical protein H0H92_006042 [Tricholoma furcatifolium]|nr:hypothetical protein H0H92_006042 [Tricholoma furcatifolium]
MATVATPLYSNHDHLFSARLDLYTVAHPTQHQEDLMEEEQFNSLFCRALYDYDAQDVSALSFQRGDIIEVLTQQPSGWWDGLLGDERGWFPSNYVEVISEEEAEIALFASETSGTESSVPETSSETSMVDIAHGRMQSMQEANELWLENEISSPRNGIPASNTFSQTSQSSEFWSPEIAPDGQIFYVNSQTGQRSRDMPSDLDDEISDTDLAGLTSQTSSRSGTSAGLAFGFNDSVDPMNNIQDIAGFGIPRRTGTPEPWVRKLHDDGRSYYFYNKLDGQVSWTRPEAPPSTSSQSSSSPPRSRTTNDSKRHSVYSDDSDVQPFEPVPRKVIANGHPAQPFPESQAARPVAKASPPDFTTAERIARSLQQAITPPPPESAAELSAAANSAIHAILDNVRSNDVGRRPEEDRKMNELIYHVVLMVRNLLYTLAIPTHQIPANVLPREVRDLPTPSQSPLKPAQRKVTATLSRLVLSARAIQYDAGQLMTDTLARIETDAEGLKKDVASFISQVHQLESQGGLPRHKHPRRLHGVFTPDNIGPGLVGAGAAGRWTGFGWVPLDNDQVSSQRVLGPEAILELRQYSKNLDGYFQNLLLSLRTSDQSSGKLQFSPLEQLVSQISVMLTLVSDIHVARHVDIDGFQQDGSSSTGPYSQTVENARLLVRTLEAAVQAVHNDVAVFLITVQSVRDSDRPQHRTERRYAWDHLDALSSSMSANIAVVMDTLDNLLSLGHQQAEMASGDYNGSIEWRMSRLSVRPISSYMINDADEPDMVDMEMAFVRAPNKPPKALDPYSPYNRPHANSDASQTLNSSSIEYDSLNHTLVSDQQELDPVLDHETTSILEEDRDVGESKPPLRPTGSKLVQLLGAEYSNKLTEETKAWYLRATYSPEDILIEPDNTVKGGTLPALVERLTAHDQVDPSFNQAFLMTFKSFTTVIELFDLLVARFRIEPPNDLKPNELEEWMKQKKQLVQIRVINTFVTMLKDDDILETEDFHIFDRMKAFVQSDEVSHIGGAKQVLVNIERAIHKNNNPLKAMPMPNPPPPPIPPKAGKKLKLTDVDPIELARQLTLMESDLYQKIKPMECLQRAREQKTDTNDNIAAVIQMSNRIADWVADSILSKEDSRKRAAVVKHLISVADRCRIMQNFSSMIAITSGLNTPPIRRLKRTWEQVNQRSQNAFQECERTIDSNKNFTKYRQLMASVTPPCVPFIGVFLSTLQFIQDGNPDILPGGLVNFRKRQKASEVINDIKRWQAQSFNFVPLQPVQAFIDESLNQYSDTKASSEHFWTLSLEREPREREDEKMARLLQESGFL